MTTPVDHSSYTPPATESGVAVGQIVVAVTGLVLLVSAPDWLTRVGGGLALAWLLFVITMQSPNLKAWTARHDTLVSWVSFGPILVAVVGWLAWVVGQHLGAF